MCAGAAFWTQIDKVVIGASDEKRGYSGKQDPLLHPRTKVVTGVMADECSEILMRFFQDRRRIEKLN
jgi:tRNA(adenine34) deaminase